MHVQLLLATVLSALPLCNAAVASVSRQTLIAIPPASTSTQAGYLDEAQVRLLPEYPEPTAIDFDPLVPRRADAYNPNPVITSPTITQFPIATTWWVETTLPDIGSTWVPRTYTQVFPPAPDPLPPPGFGQIGFSLVPIASNDSGSQNQAKMWQRGYSWGVTGLVIAMGMGRLLW